MRKIIPDKRISIKDVAERAKVSISTVSRVLNDSGYASENTKRRVMRTVRELNYTQNMVARSLRTKQSKLIGLVVPDITNEFYSQLAREIDERLLPEGYYLLLCNTMENETLEQNVIESLVLNQVSAMIIVSAGERVNDQLVRSGVPTVMIDGNTTGTQASNVVFVDCDNYNGGRMAAEKLIHGGAKRLVIQRCRRPAIAMMARERGFRDAAAENGVDPDSIASYSVNISTAEAYSQILEKYSDDRFDGLFCAADVLALGALTAFKEMKVKVPRDVQVVGFDNIPLGQYMNPPLSTIAQDFPNTAEVIVEEIKRLLAGTTHPRHMVIPVSFVQRSSTHPS